MEWINIREKWPDDENEILVCTISKKGVRNIDKGYAFGDRIVHRGTAQVTHWMPLPDMTVDEAPVVHGRWLIAHNKIENAVCSACGTYFQRYYDAYSYCPYCGAKMDLEEQNNA